MIEDLRIAPMSRDDLALAIDWAAREGWNPGLDDAAAFHAADPQGFLMGWLANRPVAAVSVVRHSDSFGFLGFYLCDPDFRGRGLGLAIWQAGIARLGNRTIGLDGVPDQQANYAASGFKLAHTSQRHGGQIAGRMHVAHSLAASGDIGELLTLDGKINGFARRAYLTAWFRSSPTRQTWVHRQDGSLRAAGTIRACRQGHKIGPLYADDAETAHAMMQTLVQAADASDVFIDIPDPNTEAVNLAKDLGLTSSFACARMYRGTPPGRKLDRVYGEVSFELG